MARGRDAHEAQEAALAALGKDLSRRAGSCCELCGGRDAPRAHAVPPAVEPDIEAAILACVRCRALIDGGRVPSDASDLRFLETVIWSDVRPVQVAAVRLLRRVAGEGVTWAAEANEGLYLPDEVAERI